MKKRSWFRLFTYSRPRGWLYWAIALVFVGAFFALLSLPAYAAGTTTLEKKPVVRPLGPLATPTRPIKLQARFTLSSQRLDVLLGRRIRISGRLRPGQAGQTVSLQLLGGSGWRTVRNAETMAGGRFAITYAVGRTSSRQARLRFAGYGRSGVSIRHLGRVTVYRPTQASWYGLIGNRTACGQTLTTGTLGVAHKTLPCGTQVTLRYGGRSVRVPVVDRGPYVGGREWDLTLATARRLNFGGVGTVWSSS